MKLNIQHLQRAWSDKSEKLEATFDRVTRILIEQIDSLSNLASSFSDFAKMPQEKFEKCDLKQIVLNSIHLFEKSSEVTFVHALTNDPVWIFADKEQISRVFHNLIKNAIQAIPDESHGKVQVVMFEREGHVVTEVIDNGTGIPDHIKDKIFVPSFSTKNSGMGLGLAISRKIVESSNGHVKYTSLSTGTSFTIELPIYHEQD